MKKLVALTPILFLAASLAACQLVSTPAPLPAPTTVPTATSIPPTPTPVPTAVPTQTPVLPLNSPNGAPLRSIHMFTPQDGWGLIDNALLVTHNGGANWASVPLPSGEITPFVASDFISLNEARLVLPAPDGKTGILYYTEDGGPDWQVFPIPFVQGQLDRNGFFMETVSSNPTGMEIAIYQTSDWVSWAKNYPAAGETIPKEGLKTGISFIDGQRGWLGLAAQPNKIGLYRTTDSGRSWSLQDLPLPQNIGSLKTSAQPPFFFHGNSTNGFLPVDFTALESEEGMRVFYATQDGGETWTPGEGLPEGGAYTFLDAQTGWAWGKRGLYSTADGGKKWLLMPVAFNRSEHATQIDFLDAQNGWLLTVGQQSRVHLYRTTNGGYGWTAVIP